MTTYHVTGGTGVMPGLRTHLEVRWTRAHPWQHLDTWSSYFAAAAHAERLRRTPCFGVRLRSEDGRTIWSVERAVLSPRLLSGALMDESVAR